MIPNTDGLFENYVIKIGGNQLTNFITANHIKGIPKKIQRPPHHTDTSFNLSAYLSPGKAFSFYFNVFFFFRSAS